MAGFIEEALFLGDVAPVLLATDVAPPSPFNTLYGLMWFVVIAFMFLAQHHTCDAYFVPAINVFVDKMRSSPNKWLQRWGEHSVAGATICALGCNGPELFSNLISLFTGSDAGIGVVVGSEIFNLLVIVGCSTLAAPCVPLVLDRFSFTRDAIAYFVSIVMLYVVLADKKVTLVEASVLLFTSLLYVSAVYFTKDVENWAGGGSAKIADGLSQKLLEEAATKTTSSKSNDSTASRRTSASFNVDPKCPNNRSRSAEKHFGTIHGVTVEVDEIVHGRMVDGHHDASHMLTTVNDGNDVCPDDSFRLETEEGHHGPTIQYKTLKEVVVMGEGVIELEFEVGVMGGLILEHFSLKLTCATSDDRDRLLNAITAHNGKAWVHGYDASIVGGWQHFKHEIMDPDLSIFLKVVYMVPEFMIDSILRLTLFAVDIKDINKENRWPLCFMGAMCWLAFFSYCMLECANLIHYYIPIIPTSFLGITVCAVGTSFPNAVASVILSQQNKPSAAIANALGSNIQNVFLAMALPWVIFCLVTGVSEIEMSVAGISEGVVWMVGTLALLLIFVLTPPCCKLTKVSGYILNSTYVVYLVDIAGETFGWWPPFMN